VLNKIAHFADNDVLIKDVVGKINKSNRTITEPLQREYRILKNSLEAIQSKKDKALGLYEDGILNKTDLTDRLEKLDEEKRLLEDRIVPIEQKLGQGGKQEISFKMVKQVMNHFEDCYKNSITAEQRKQLLHLLINKITIANDRKIESIQIQMNNEVVRHFTKQGEDKSSSDDDLSSPFSIFINL
jgi:site-specific DNA recombinase